MSILRGVGKFAGKAAGLVIGGPIQVVGEITGVKLIEDIGKGTRKASEFAGDTVGQVAAGAVDTVSGLLNDNETQRNKGLGEMGSAVSRTAKGVVVTAKNTIQSGGEVVGGFIDGDNERIKKGATDIVKSVAVGVLAVGVVDVVDGPDGAEAAETPETETKVLDNQLPTEVEENNLNPGETVKIETINDDLAGTEHPETGVPFEEKTVELQDGSVVTGTFPEFDVEYEVHIDESLYLQSDHVHFSYANQELYDAIQTDPDLAEDLGLSEDDIQGLVVGDTPEGFTWHHNEEPGTLQLVEEEVHANTGHTGGREIWGGGGEFR